MGVHRFSHGDVRNHFYFRIALALLVIVPASISGSNKGDRSVQLTGYKAVRVHYGPLNKMIMPVYINGQPAKLLVDTAATHVMLDADAAASFGIKPSQRGLRYIQFSEINGQELPMSFAQNLTAGNISFGSVLVTLHHSNYSGSGNAHVDGVLGLDVLTRYKAVINCRTKLVFFKVNPGRQMNLASMAAAEKFARIPLRREQNGALTVPCLIHGRSTRLLVDTGAFITTFDDAFLKPLGIALEQTRLSAHFARGAARKISAGKINDFMIGGFKMRPAKFGATALRNFALPQGDKRITGILGLDTLYNYHAIIDLDGMNLFLK